jgi:hypothetical protein
VYTILLTEHREPDFSDNPSIFSRKGAKAQSFIQETKAFFAPLRLCAFAGKTLT